MSYIIEYLYVIPAVIIALVLHELSHSLMSYWLGDPTPKEEGRLSLNPLRHIDPFGMICLIIFHFGWAKPVRVNPQYYRHPKWGMALVAFAGPLMNFILANIFTILYIVFIAFVPETTFTNILTTFFSYCLVINIGLGLFNLIPIPPLDGSKMLGALLPDEAYYQYMKYERYGTILLLIILLLLRVLSYFGMPDLLEYVITVVTNFFVRIWAHIFQLI